MINGCPCLFQTHFTTLERIKVVAISTCNSHQAPATHCSAVLVSKQRSLTPAGTARTRQRPAALLTTGWKPPSFEFIEALFGSLCLPSQGLSATFFFFTILIAVASSDVSVAVTL